MKRFFAIALAVFAMTACNHRTNPFLEEWNTPYGIPPFEKIQNADYLPALQEGIKAHNAEIQAIVDNPEAPTFDNVIAAFDASGELLAKVSGVLFNLAETDNSDELEKVVEEATTLVANHENEVIFNKPLFAKVEAVNKQKDQLGLTREQEMVLDKIYRSFADNGIALDEAGQARMMEINTELSTLSNRFGNYLLKENNAFKAKFDVAISEYRDVMAAEEDRAKREEMFRAFAARGNNGNEYDTKEIILNILKLKEEKARLLGYPNPAAQILSDKMAKTPEAVDAFLANIFKYAVAQAKSEVKEMQKEMDLDIAAGKVEKGAKIQPWDWFYYAEKVRKVKYALDEELTKPYFQMENVRQGVFNTASKLYGLQFEKIENAPIYHPDVEVFKVSDADGSLIGVLTTDYFPRESKRGGAWMNNIRDQYVT
ncbi:MAG: peptidase M3, partial [Bacteroidales bacterium]|nr:peptidase M3 [Bacteroidales bacterium]